MIVKNVLLFLLFLLLLDWLSMVRCLECYACCTHLIVALVRMCVSVCAGSIGAECLSPLHVCTRTCISLTVFVCINVCL